MDVLEAIKGRWSTRAFTKQPVSQEIVAQILATASRAPSGVNHQPWQVHALTGAAKTGLSEKIIAARSSGMPENPDYKYYPDEWVEPYKSRRQACGIALYSALGIKREDKERRKEVWQLNYHFFHAPVGLIFLVEKRMSTGSWMDMGMFIQTTMLAARGYGLDSCAQASLAEYPDIVREHLGVSSDWDVVCGMALGYADNEHPINQYRTERDSVDEFLAWHE